MIYSNKVLGSHGERLVDSILGFNGMKYKREYSFKNSIGTRQRMDFLVEYKGKFYCIEYMGEQHYRQVFNLDFDRIKLLDRIKKEYCDNNNITYIDISYKNRTLEQVYVILRKYFREINKPDTVEVYTTSLKFNGNINVYTKNGRYLYTGNYNDVINKYKLTDSNFYKCLIGELNSTSGYKFSLVNEEQELERKTYVETRRIKREESIKNAPRKTTSIAMYDLDKNEEIIFKSIKECEIETGIRGVSSYLYGNTDRLTLSNKMFRLLDEEYKYSPEEVRKRSQKKMIKGTNIDTGDIVEGTVNEVARIINASAPNISKVLKGKSKHCKRYKFIYL
ncbi:HNH endonuclease [Staphylococcus phage Metroid]|nr:HNH endonuclease [Staphylococcus phage Metroid]